jgi:hypothetical protein
MNFKLNKEHNFENVAKQYAKQNNLIVILKYYSWRPGEKYIVESAKFIEYDNFDKFCNTVISACYDHMDDCYEIPDYLTNDEMKITIDSYKAVIVSNIPIDKINIAEHDEIICEKIKNELDKKLNKIK